ncbi:MAG TPA: MFS transporter [Gammaproteobacteria bacterium]|jgi:MFS family permease|nr:MFS transporter [Gammaproteobacteria bacterium]
MNEVRHKNPIIDRTLFHHHAYRSCCAVTALNNFTMYALLFQVPILLIVMGIKGPLVAGTVLFGMTAAMMVSGLASGFITNLFGQRQTLIGAQLFSIIGFVLLLQLKTGPDKEMITAAIAFIGIGVDLTMPIIQTVAMSSLPVGQAGMAAGGMGVTRYLGGVLGISIMSLLLQAGDNLETHKLLFEIHIGIAIVIAGIALMLPAHQRVVD